MWLQWNVRRHVKVFDQYLGMVSGNPFYLASLRLYSIWLWLASTPAKTIETIS